MIYSKIDLRYSDPNDLVTMVNSRVMVIEIILNIVAVYLVHHYISSVDGSIEFSHIMNLATRIY